MLSKAQQDKIVRNLAKAASFDVAKTERKKAFGVIVNATIDGVSLKSHCGEALAIELTGRVLDLIGYTRYTGIAISTKSKP